MASREYNYALVCYNYPDREEFKVEEVRNLGLESDEIKIGTEIPYEGGELLEIVQLGIFYLITIASYIIIIIFICKQMWVRDL